MRKLFLRKAHYVISSKMFTVYVKKLEGDIRPTSCAPYRVIDGTERERYVLTVNRKWLDQRYVCGSFFFFS